MSCHQYAGYYNQSPGGYITPVKKDVNCRNCGSSLIIDGGCGHCGTGRIAKVKATVIPEYYTPKKLTALERFKNIFK